MKYHLLFCVSFCLLAHSICGQMMEELTPSEKKQLTVVNEPQTLFKGFVRVGVSFNTTPLDKIFDNHGNRENFPGNIWASSGELQLGLAYGITNRLQLSASFPYRYINLYQSVRQEVADIGVLGTKQWQNEARGLADIWVATSYQIVTQSVARPSQTVTAYLRLPTGEKNPSSVKNEFEYKPALGTGEMSAIAEYQLRQIVYPYVYSVYLSYQYFAGGSKKLQPMDLNERPFRSGGNMSLGGYFNFHLNEWIAVRNSGQFFFSSPDTFDGTTEPDPSWTLQYSPGLNFQIGQFRIAQGVTIPLLGKLSPADPTYLFIVQMIL